MENDRIKIVIVDDEEGIRMFIRTALLRRGFLVETAATGRELISIVFRKKPDLIVLDVMMPDVSGIEVYKILQGNAYTRHTPVIFCTSLAMECLSRDVDLKGNGYVRKPFEVDELYSEINRLLKFREHNT